MVICRKCGQNKKVSLPPVRNRNAPCDICGSQDEDPKGMNYDFVDMLMPGNPNEPNARAEREFQQQS